MAGEACFARSKIRQFPKLFSEGLSGTIKTLWSWTTKRGKSLVEEISELVFVIGKEKRTEETGGTPMNTGGGSWGLCDVTKAWEESGERTSMLRESAPML